jgi:hypothetical protein
VNIRLRSTGSVVRRVIARRTSTLAEARFAAMSAMASRTVSFHAFASTPNWTCVPSASQRSRTCRSVSPDPTSAIDPYRCHTKLRTRPNRLACSTRAVYLLAFSRSEYAIRVTVT